MRLFALWLALAATGTLAKDPDPTPSRKPKAPTSFVAVEVLEVVELENGTWAVLLAPPGGEMVLPIFIGPTEGLAIRLRLDHQVSPRPLTHDLLEDVVDVLGGKVVRVDIDDLKADTFLGRITLQQGERTHTLDARPSDSIALALGTGALIRVAKPVLDRAALSPKNLHRRAEPPNPGLKTESL